MSISDQDFQPIWFGTYQKIGWGKYETKGLGTNTVSPGVVRSTYLRLISSDRYIKEEYKKYYSGYLFRDFRVWTCRKAVNHPSNEWMSPPSRTGLHVIGTPGKRNFRAQFGGYGKQYLEAELDYLFKQSLQIYTASNEVPSVVLEALEEQGVGYTIHANQEWVTHSRAGVNREVSTGPTRVACGFLFHCLCSV